MDRNKEDVGGSVDRPYTLRVRASGKIRRKRTRRTDRETQTKTHRDTD